MTAVQKTRLLAWLAHIEETDPAVIEEILARCDGDMDARAYFLERAGREVPEPCEVTCGQCTHFRRTGGHAHLGRCDRGEPERPGGLWDGDQRICSSYDRRTT